MSGGSELLGGVCFETGTGLIRLGMSETWRRRMDGFITEFERILVPYWCWDGACGLEGWRGWGGVATDEFIRRRSLTGAVIREV